MHGSRLHHDFSRVNQTLLLSIVAMVLCARKILQHRIRRNFRATGSFVKKLHIIEMYLYKNLYLDFTFAHLVSKFA